MVTFAKSLLEAIRVFYLNAILFSIAALQSQKPWSLFALVQLTVSPWVEAFGTATSGYHTGNQHVGQDIRNPKVRVWARAANCLLELETQLIIYNPN